MVVEIFVIKASNLLYTVHNMKCILKILGHCKFHPYHYSLLFIFMVVSIFRLTTLSHFAIYAATTHALIN